MDDNNIQINPTKSSELEFDVMIQGISKTDVPNVRFVIIAAVDACDYSFTCVRVKDEKSKWLVNMPAMPQVKSDSAKFRVEVIIDDNYFEPANGTITFVSASEVNFGGKTTPKPTVTTSFTVKQGDDKKEEPIKTEKKKTSDHITETAQGGGGGEITGRYAPTNALLKPEEDPTENGRMKGDSSVNDEFIDKDRLSLDKAEDLSSNITPGEGRAYQQEPAKEGRNGRIVPSGIVAGENDTERAQEDEETFDPKQVADDIMKSMIGSIPKTTAKGTLFKRDASGKTVIKGLESAQAKQEAKDKAQKIRDIIKSI